MRAVNSFIYYLKTRLILYFKFLAMKNFKFEFIILQTLIKEKHCDRIKDSQFLNFSAIENVHFSSKADPYE
jgi:hypothetical protein